MSGDCFRRQDRPGRHGSGGRQREEPVARAWKI